jgi:hypothetical protein
MGTDHLFGLGPAPVAEPQPQTPATPEQPRTSGVTAGWGTTTTTATASTAQDAIDEAEAARRKLRQAMDEAGQRDGDLDAQFRSVVDGGGLGWTPPTVDAAPVELGKKPDPRKALVFEIVAGAGGPGIGPEAIREFITRLHPAVDPPHAATIGRWLDADPRIHKPSYGRYAVRPDLDQ